MGVMRKMGLLFNTVKFLKPIQIKNQIALRFKSKESFWAYKKVGVNYKEHNIFVDEIDSSPQYIDRFKPDMLVKNQLTLLNETRPFIKWNYEDASHLWNFNLHYLEYLVALKSLSGEGDIYTQTLNRIITDWYDNGSGEDDSNQAYTVSLRIINQLLISDVVYDKQRLFESIYAQYRFLLNHQEKHLLGNHYFENIKAIVICSVVFDEEDIYQEYIIKLIKELREEITSDGLHFELSLMYHKIILEDLIRIALVLKQAKKKEYGKLVHYVQKMLSALYSLEYGINRTPLFNDAGDNVAKTSDSLIIACKRLFHIKPEKHDYISGYYKLYDNAISVIADCGELAPKYMPGHSHCDCLSFELFYNGNPIFVNCGTYQYQGEKRGFFRSTAAHNTVMINNHEQSELWGEHRAARRIRQVISKRVKHGVIGKYTNYLNETHKRKIVLNNCTFCVLDSTSGSGIVKSFLHLAPGLSYKNGVISGNGLMIRITPVNSNLQIEQSEYAPSFGEKYQIDCLVFQWQNDNQKHGYQVTFI